MKKILLTDSNIHEVKVKLLEIIMEIIKTRGLNQTEAASFLGIDQPKISQMKYNRVEGFSLERLLLFLVKLHHKVELAIDELEIMISKTD